MSALLALRAAWAWISGSKAGRIVAAALGVMLALRVIYWRGLVSGRAQEKDYIDRKSNEAAQRRREERDEVDRGARRPGAAQRLRDRWSRPPD